MFNNIKLEWLMIFCIKQMAESKILFMLMDGNINTINLGISINAN